MADDGFLYAYDASLADRAVSFIESLKHIKGREWAGRPIVLEDWQCFIVSTIFGWVDLAGDRRFKAAYIEVPRKNAKSTLSSAIGLYMLVADGEPGAEVYSAATTRDQARIVYNAAKRMIESDGDFKAAFDLKLYGGVSTSGSIVEDATGGVFRPLARESGGNLDGLNVHCGIIDELHAHKTREIFDVIETGTGARTQPLVWSITTAGFNRSGICYEQRRYVKSLLEGRESDETYFGIVYTIDESDDWQKRESWIKANPNWGISVNPMDIDRKAQKAIATSSAQNNFLTKHLDVWVNAATAWLNMAALQKCVRESLDWAEFEGCQTWISLDLASRVDIAAVNYTWRRDGKIWSKARYYLPRGTIEEEVNASYEGWAIDGHLTATSGQKTDFAAIEAQLKKDLREYAVEAIAYDPYQAQYLANNLAADGVEMIEYPQNLGNMSEPMKEWEGLVLAGEYVYDGNPVTTWMISNVVCRVDAKDNIFPIKDDPANKIDGAVAQIMSIGLCAGAEEGQDVIFL